MKLYHITLGPIATNCYLCSDDNLVTAIIDPGAEAAEIIAVCEKNNLAPTAILLTHAHFDHIGGVCGLCSRYPEIKVYLNALDKPLATKYSGGELPDFVAASDYAGLTIHHEVTDNQVISIGELSFTVIATPGHTRGGVCYLSDQFLFSGDTLFKHEVGRTDLEGGSYPTLLHSLKRLYDLPGNPTVLPGHEGFSSLQEEREQNSYMREALK